MDQPAANSPQPKPHNSLGFAFLALIAVGGSAAGVFVYQGMQSKQEKTGMDTSGFDIAEVSPEKALSGPSRVPEKEQSSLGMVAVGNMPSFQTGTNAGKPPAQGGSAGPARPQSIKERAMNAVKEAEKAITKLALDYERRYPSMTQYGREWASKPDLKALTQQFHRDKDPIAFMKGLSNSPSFGGMVKKYATKSEFQGFAKDAMKVAPPGAMEIATEVMNDDATIKKLVDTTMGALGLPPGLLSMAGNDPNKIDQNAIMNSVMGSNPEMQKAMSNPDVQKQLQNNPQLQNSSGKRLGQ